MTAETTAAPQTTADELTLPVVGMTCASCVNPEIATAQGLRSDHDDQTYYFCGKGCKLDFDENAERILDPSYTPSM